MAAAAVWRVMLHLRVLVWHKAFARQVSFNVDARRCLPKDALSTDLARVRERTRGLETGRTPTPRAHRRAECRSPLLRAVQSRSAARRGRIGLNAPPSAAAGASVNERRTRVCSWPSVADLSSRNYASASLARSTASLALLRAASASAGAATDQHHPSRQRLQPSK
jgi:hypothetical protein